MKRDKLQLFRYVIVAVFFVCVAVFAWMTRFMLRRNERAMTQICQTYTMEMGHQLANHFGSVVGLRLDVTGFIAEQVDAAEYDVYTEEMAGELGEIGQIRGFAYMGLFAEDGTMDTVYGETVEVINGSLFQENVIRDGRAIVTGVTVSGKVMILFGVHASYPMEGGNTSYALVTGLPVEYIQYAMSPREQSSLVYYHIVRKDGSYVIHNPNNHADNYLDWLSEEPDYEGKTREQVMAELTEALGNGQEYAMIGIVDGEKRSIYFDPLSNSECYLVTVLLYGTLDDVVTDLGNKQLTVGILSCGLILVVLLLVFVAYMRMARRHLAEVEQERQRADYANHAKSEFLSNMSHDIRTPMNVIVGMTAIATDHIDDKETVTDALQKITISSRHLLGLINDVLDMSKIETGRLTVDCEQLSLRELMEGVVNIAQPQVKAKNHNFDVFIENIQCEDVFSDGIRLSQVLINLLSNAVKYTLPGGSIFVRLSQEDSPKGEKYVRNHIRVQDTGIGMSEEFQKKIFESFTREDDKRVKQIEGTGLGMAITKYIVDAMEGTIEVKSELGKGSEFHVTLDLEKAELPERDMTLPPWDLLFVDDDAGLCRYSANSLAGMGIQAEWALSGNQAILMAEKRVEEQKPYEIVLVDWKMPEMDGIETARQLRRVLGEDVPILLISAYDWTEIEKEAREAGIRGFIGKPLFKSTLYHGLARFSEQPKDVAEVRETETKPDFTGRRLLVAEDYDMNWEICNRLLSVFGFELEWAENGQICVDRFLASEPGFYDAILMDLRMPVMNGYQATEKIRSSGRPDADVAIIAMTADAFSEDVQKCEACGMNASVAKPLDLNKMIAILQTYMR